MGMDIYAKASNTPGKPEFVTSCIPKPIDNTHCESSFQFANSDNCMREITLYLPLYSKVKSIEIGLEESADVAEPHAYATDLPVVFYGSSITQGACSSRPGNSYPAILSRLLDCDFLNLGFSGNAHGEAALAEYISKIPMSAFVLDYDYNAQSVQKLEDTHFNFYQIIRDTNPDLPIIMVSAPVSPPAILIVGEKRMEMSRIAVMESYIRAKRAGDNNVYFIDGESLLGDICAKDALLDRVHPTDLGFQSMANRVYPILRFVRYGI